mgnify:CR=1 FL=1
MLKNTACYHTLSTMLDRCIQLQENKREYKLPDIDRCQYLHDLIMRKIDGGVIKLTTTSLWQLVDIADFWLSKIKRGDRLIDNDEFIDDEDELSRVQSVRQGLMSALDQDNRLIIDPRRQILIEMTLWLENAECDLIEQE